MAKSGLENPMAWSANATYLVGFCRPFKEGIVNHETWVWLTLTDVYPANHRQGDGAYVGS
jgi:hypothetical protein